MKNKSNSILVGTILVVLLTLELWIIGELFPGTGLKAIIVLPFIYIICIIIIIAGLFISKKLNNRFQIFLWVFLFLSNTMITLNLYPQEFRPSVWKQFNYTIDVVSNYDKISEDDLNLFNESKYNAFDKSVPDDRERYVAALHKYQHVIKRDGSVFLYGNKDKPIKKETRIKNELETGQDKLLWLLLR